MEFSFVIPTLNEQQYLPNLLTSLALQTINDYEVIVIDGASKDNTKHVALRFSAWIPRLTFTSMQPPSLPAQRNLGGFASKSRWIVFVDADSILSTTFLQEVVGYIKKHSRAGVITTWCRPDTNSFKDKTIAGLQNCMTSVGAMLNRYISHGSLTIVRAEIFRELGGYNESYEYAEDIEFSNRLNRKGIRLAVIRKPLYTLSLRRYRSQGYVRVLVTYISTLFYSFVVGMIPMKMKEYSMGGHNYQI